MYLCVDIHFMDYIQVLDLGRLIYTAYKSIPCSFIYTDSIVLAGAHANMCVLWGLSILNRLHVHMKGVCPSPKISPLMFVYIMFTSCLHHAYIMYHAYQFISYA